MCYVVYEVHIYVLCSLVHTSSLQYCTLVLRTMMNDAQLAHLTQRNALNLGMKYET